MHIRERAEHRAIWRGAHGAGPTRRRSLRLAAAEAVIEAAQMLQQGRSARNSQSFARKMMSGAAAGPSEVHARCLDLARFFREHRKAYTVIHSWNCATGRFSRDTCLLAAYKQFPEWEHVGVERKNSSRAC